MKEIVVISGKGGTGKTSITASFSILGGQDVVTADCDVDAADMHLLLQPDFAAGENFYSGFKARIDPSMCTGCDTCAGVCRFAAIKTGDGVYGIVPLDCEGCGYCARVCPEKAVIMEEQNVGRWYRSAIKTGGIMIHARLGVGADNSGKLVAKVKKEARRAAEENGRDIILVDGSPGIGCPVVSSLTGADFVLFVTEPTVSGLHDLKRVSQLVKRFGIPSGCIINKADLNRDVTIDLKDFLREEGIVHLADLPYDEAFSRAMVLGRTIVESGDGEIAGTLAACWQKIAHTVQ